MPGKSKLTADAAEQATLRDLSKSEHRGEADRARAILLTLEGRRAEDIAAVLGVHVSTVRNWRGYFAHGGVAGGRGGPGAGEQGPIGGPPGGGAGGGGGKGFEKKKFLGEKNFQPSLNQIRRKNKIKKKKE